MVVRKFLQREDGISFCEYVEKIELLIEEKVKKIVDIINF